MSLIWSTVLPNFLKLSLKRPRLAGVISASFSISSSFVKAGFPEDPGSVRGVTSNFPVRALSTSGCSLMLGKYLCQCGSSGGGTRNAMIMNTVVSDNKPTMMAMSAPCQCRIFIIAAKMTTAAKKLNKKLRVTWPFWVLKKSIVGSIYRLLKITDYEISFDKKTVANNNVCKVRVIICDSQLFTTSLGGW